MQLLSGVNSEQSATLARLSEIQEIKAGEVIFTAGEPADMLYVLIEGEVEVSQGGTPIARLTAGETFGEVTLLDDRVHSGTVRATKDSRLALVSREALERVSSRRPDIALTIYRNLARGLGQKLDRTNRGALGS